MKTFYQLRDQYLDGDDEVAGSLFSAIVALGASANILYRSELTLLAILGFSPAYWILVDSGYAVPDRIPPEVCHTILRPVVKKLYLLLLCQGFRTLREYPIDTPYVAETVLPFLAELAAFPDLKKYQDIPVQRHLATLIQTLAQIADDRSDRLSHFRYNIMLRKLTIFLAKLPIFACQDLVDLDAMIVEMMVKHPHSGSSDVNYFRQSLYQDLIHGVFTEILLRSKFNVLRSSTP